MSYLNKPLRRNIQNTSDNNPMNELNHQIEFENTQPVRERKLACVNASMKSF